VSPTARLGVALATARVFEPAARETTVSAQKASPTCGVVNNKVAGGVFHVEHWRRSGVSSLEAEAGRAGRPMIPKVHLHGAASHGR
jgi:hypothetical protein